MISVNQIFKEKINYIFFLSLVLVFLELLLLPGSYVSFICRCIVLLIFLFCFLKKQYLTFSILAIILEFFVVVDLVTKRMADWYFYQIPLEIISICLDTNFDEIRSTFNFSKLEYYLIFLLILNAVLFSYVFFQKIDVSKSWYKTGNKKSAVIFFILFSLFVLGFKPIRVTIKTLVFVAPEIVADYKKIEERKSFSWGARSTDLNPITVVLFLGETHRGDHLQINGYGRETTPNLMTQNVISFGNAISQASYTLASTPMILSRKNVNDKGIFPEKSLITAFKEAGYQTWYISYLKQAHIGDNEINLIIKEADHYVRAGVDSEILRQVLDDRSEKKLIVYKTIGAHFLYHDRYPKDFEFFVPSFDSESYRVPQPVEKDIVRLINSYDNAIRYSVDFQINSIIELLKQRQEQVVFCFVSDHGTAIFEDGKSLYGGSSPANYNIAWFYWFNEEYLKEKSHKKLVNFLKAHVNEKITSEYIVDTLFDLSGIQTDKRKGYSLITEKLSQHPRRVLNGNTVVDYDKIFTKNKHEEGYLFTK